MNVAGSDAFDQPMHFTVTSDTANVAKVRAAVEGAARRIGAIHRRHADPRHARRDERVVLWYGGQKVELSVEAWLRGH